MTVFLSHPIQHYIPWFAALAKDLGDEFKVVYSCRHGLDQARDPEFGETFSWDMDLLQGYRHEFYEQQGRAVGPERGFRGIRFPGVKEYLRRERPEAVMIFGWLFAGYWEVARAAQQLGIPYFMRAESNLLSRGHTAKWWLKQQTVGRLCRKAAACLSIGERNRELFRAYGVPEERIRLAPYFVDNELFGREAARGRQNREALRARFGLPRDAIVFLFMGKLVAKKHPDHLLRAWHDLPDEIRERSALLFGGSGALMDDLRHEAAGDPRVAFAGFLNRKQLPEAYAASDVLVLPSDEGESWGLVVNEAMASGLPGIVSDRVGCGPDLVVEGETGMVFPFGDLSSLTRCLRQMVENEQARVRMGERANRHIGIATAERAASVVVDAVKELRTPRFPAK